VLPAPVAVLSPPEAPGLAALDCVAVPSSLVAAGKHKRQNLVKHLRNNTFNLIMMSIIALWATKLL
jgi:hypothetical protein